MALIGFPQEVCGLGLARWLLVKTKVKVCACNWRWCSFPLVLFMFYTCYYVPSVLWC